MSQSLLTNSALECKVAGTGGSTLVKMSFSDATASFQGATSGTKVKLAGVSDPVNTSDVATKNYVDSQLSGLSLGLSWKSSSRVRTTEHLDATYASGSLTATDPAEGLPQIDGVSLNVGDRVLIMNQQSSAHNGLYKVASSQGPWSFDRTSDADTITKLIRASTYIEEGTSYSGRGYTQSADATNLGSDDLEFSQFASISEVSATDGLTMSGKNIMVNTDSNRALAIVSDKVGVIDKGITTSLIDDVAVGTPQLADGCVIPQKLAVGCINNSDKFTGEVVDNDALATDAVSAIKIASNAVEERAIKDSNVTRDKIADQAINASKIEASAVGNTELEDGSVSSVKIGGGQVKSVNIGAGEVKNVNYEGSSITHDKIASNAVITSKIATQNITTALINQTQGSQAVTTACIRDDAITHDKLSENAVESENIKSNAITEVKLADGCVSERTLGVFNQLSVNGPVVATSFVAGGSTAGNTSMSLARAVMTKVSFDNNAFPITNDFTAYPNANACIQFSYNDNIGAVLPMWVSAFETDGTPNMVEAKIMIQYYNNDGSQTLDTSDANEIDHLEFETGTDTYYPEGSQTLAVKQSSPSFAGEDRRIGKIWIEVKKNASGLVTTPIGADLNLIALVVADDSGATTISY